MARQLYTYDESRYSIETSGGWGMRMYTLEYFRLEGGGAHLHSRRDELAKFGGGEHHLGPSVAASASESF